MMEVSSDYLVESVKNSLNVAVQYTLLFMPKVLAHNVTNTQDYEFGGWLLYFQAIPLGPLVPSIPEGPGHPGEPGSP